MLNVVELFQTGGLVDLVVDLVQLGLEGKMSIKSILGESYSHLEDHHHGLRSQEYEMIGMLTGKGKNPVKEEETERENRRGLVSDLMTDQGNVITGRIDITEIAKGPETGIRKKIRDVTVSEGVTVIGAEIVVETMSVTETRIVTALERGIGKGIGIMTLGILNMIVTVIQSMTMTTWDQNMSEAGMGKGNGTLIMLTQRMILNCLSSVIVGIDVQKLNMTVDTTIIMNNIKFGGNMII